MQCPYYLDSVSSSSDASSADADTEQGGVRFDTARNKYTGAGAGARQAPPISRGSDREASSLHVRMTRNEYDWQPEAEASPATGASTRRGACARTCMHTVYYAHAHRSPHAYAHAHPPGY